MAQKAETRAGLTSLASVQPSAQPSRYLWFWGAPCLHGNSPAPGAVRSPAAVGLAGPRPFFCLVNLRPGAGAALRCSRVLKGQCPPYEKGATLTPVSWGAERYPREQGFACAGHSQGRHLSQYAVLRYFPLLWPVLLCLDFPKSVKWWVALGPSSTKSSSLTTRR